jgi:short-subunit dehydrogenase
VTKTVLITGASSGLGLSHAIYLTAKGYKVIGTSRNAENLDLEILKKKFIRDHTKYKINSDMTVEEKGVKLPGFIEKNLDDLISKIKFITVDVNDTESIKSGLSGIAASVDVLVNNAGNGYFGTVEELSIEEVESQFNVNYFGYIRMIQEVLPYMRERKDGRIINTSSLAGIVGIPFQSHYSASKAAVLRMSESLSAELKPFNIGVSLLIPGDINTPFNATTANLFGNKTMDSTELGDIKSSFGSDDSPYKEKSDIVWEVIVKNLIVSPPPLMVSKKLEKIIKAKKPKAHYKVGSLFQVFAMRLVPRLLSSSLTTRIMATFYGI